MCAENQRPHPASFLLQNTVSRFFSLNLLLLFVQVRAVSSEARGLDPLELELQEDVTGAENQTQTP